MAQINAAVIAEGRNWLASGGIELVDEIHNADDDAPVFLIRAAPKSKAAVGLCTRNAGVEVPFQRAGGGIYGKDFLRRRDPEKNAVNFDWACLQSAAFCSVERPRNLQLLHVGLVDLS